MHPFFYYHKTNSTFIYNNTLTKRKELPREKVALSIVRVFVIRIRTSERSRNPDDEASPHFQGTYGNKP